VGRENVALLALYVCFTCVLFIVTAAMLVRLGSSGTFLPYGSFRSSSIKIGPFMSEGNIFKSLQTTTILKTLITDAK
jgi:hypothetical protein